MESIIGVIPGQQLQRDTLTRAMLVVSANDAARALAVDIAGSEAAFAEMMNAQAAALGLDQHPRRRTSPVSTPTASSRPPTTWSASARTSWATRPSRPRPASRAPRSTARRSGRPTTCSARIQAPTASRRATPRRPAGASSPRPTGRAGASSSPSSAHRPRKRAQRRGDVAPRLGVHAVARRYKGGRGRPHLR